MAGTGAYAMPADMPFVSKKPLKRTMSRQAKEYFDYMNSREVELFEDEITVSCFRSFYAINSIKSAGLFKK